MAQGLPWAIHRLQRVARFALAGSGARLMGEPISLKALQAPKAEFPTRCLSIPRQTLESSLCRNNTLGGGSTL
jgi:hypothetical protein